MSIRLSLVIVASVIGVLAASSPVAGAREAAPIKITSSLDGKKVLPLKIRWLAHPKVASAQIARVDFLIDGKVRCVERFAPYNYGSDDFRGHLGSLVTTWLQPGTHRFTVRVALRDGRQASHTVEARVLPAPKPPTALAGRWERTIDDATLPSGPWELIFDRVGAWALGVKGDPNGSGIVEHVSVRGDTIRIDGGVWMTAYVEGRGQPPLNRYGYRDIGSFFCREDGPPGSYRWSRSGDRLTLTPVSEPCRDRRAVWEGVWTRS